jgi:hypothetical protein
MDKARIIEAAVALNESKLSPVNVKTVAIKQEDLKELFYKACEAVPPEKEKSLPKLVGDVYNELVAEDEATPATEPEKEKGEEKVEKKNGKKVETKKEEPKKNGKKEEPKKNGKKAPAPEVKKNGKKEPVKEKKASKRLTAEGVSRKSVVKKLFMANKKTAAEEKATELGISPKTYRIWKNKWGKEKK